VKESQRKKTFIQSVIKEKKDNLAQENKEIE
jgi:hypothetical protein